MDTLVAFGISFKNHLFFYYLAYFCYYSLVLLYFLVLFIGRIILFMGFIVFYILVHLTITSRNNLSKELVNGFSFFFFFGWENCKRFWLSMLINNVFKTGLWKHFCIWWSKLWFCRFVLIKVEVHLNLLHFWDYK